MEVTKSLSKFSSPQQMCADKIKENLKTFKSGANDVIVVQQSKEGCYKATPIHIRVGKFSSWKNTVQSKGKKSFIKNGVIKTATFLVNDVEVLSGVDFTLSDSGDEVMIRRPNKLASSSNEQQLGTVSSSQFTSEELNSMKLKKGKNQVTFCGGEELGNLKIRFSFYLFHQDDRLIFTDIDGTITRSDVKGFLGGNLENYLPSIKGRRFTSDVHHDNVVKFLHKASSNGYVVVYLTARPIDFDSQTRKYLFTSLQNRDGGYSLPESPLFSGSKCDIEQCTSGSRVSYNPSIVKATTIGSILALFDLKEKVVYGAFGNKTTDAIAYSEASIPDDKVYLIDEAGCIVQMKDLKTTSYEEISNNINSIFPPITLPI